MRLKIKLLITGIACFAGLAVSSPKAANAQACGAKGVWQLPCWKEFLDDGEGNESLPFYPYAKRPNGCSLPIGRPGEYDNFGSLGYDFSFQEVCNSHDICYYTDGTTPGQCNIPFAEGLLKVCANGAFQPLRKEDILSGGTARAAAIRNCIERAKWMSGAVIAAQEKYHNIAQTRQRRYLKKVDEYIAAASKPETLPTEVRLVTAYAGIAASPETQRYYYAWNYDDKKRLENSQKAECGVNCQFVAIEEQREKKYLALAFGQRAMGIASGDSIEKATWNALYICKHYSDDPNSCYIELVLNPREGKVQGPANPPYVELKSCFSVDSRQGWQSFPANHKVSGINYVEGGWSVDSRSYSMVSYTGHQGTDAERLAPFNAYKYNQSFPFGALLMELPNGEVIWANQPGRELGSFSKGSTFRFRINDADAALGDNGGSLKVCLVYGAG